MQRFIKNLLDHMVRPVSRTGVFAWWRSAGARHRRGQAIASLLLITCLMFAGTPVTLAAPCSFTEDGNGDVIIAANCEIAAGTYNITRDFVINAGVTVTAQSGTGTGVIINAGRDLTISSTAVLTSTGQGFAAQAGTGVGSSTSTVGGGGAHGGDGGSSVGGAPYGSVTQPTTAGSGGGDDTGNGIGTVGAGGGAIKLAATGTVTVNGTVSANGTSATGGCGGDEGGGAGGSIWIDNPSGTVTGTGTVTANGGTGKCSLGGGGGGGRIAVYYSGTAPSFTYQAFGGATAAAGGAGTVYTKEATQTNGSLLVDNNNVAGDLTTQVTTASQTYDAVTVRNGAKYVIPDTFTLALAVGGTFTGGGTAQPSMTVQSGGTFDPNTATFTFQGIDVTNASGGTISDVTDLTLNDSTFDHDGSFSATVTQLTFASGASPSTFFHNGSGLDEMTLAIGNGGTFVAETTGYTGLTSLTVNSTGTFRQQHASTIAITTVTVQSGGTITSGDNTTSKLYEVDISATDIDIQASGTVTTNGLGFDPQQGTGVGSSTSTIGGGGGHGGNGGCTGSGCGGITYGSVTQPVDLGSGGGDDTGNGIGTVGAGGGAIKLAATGTVTVNGTVSANGTSATGGCGGDEGGGAGGSVWIDNPSGTVTGSGTVTVNGGDGKCSLGGAGGGGRIAVYYSGTAPSFTTQAFGGPVVSGGRGGAGTIYTKSAAQTNGSLLVDNNNVTLAPATTQATTASQTYDTITIRNGARYVIPNTHTLTLAASGTFTGGGSTTPTLETAVGGTFDPNLSTFDFSNISVTNAGTITDVTTLTKSGAGTFTHTGDLSATVTTLSVTGSSSFVHQGTGLNITDGANFTLNTSGTFTHDSATGFGASLAISLDAGTFDAVHTSFGSLASLTVTGGATFRQSHVSTIAVGILTVQSGGTVTSSTNSSSKLYEVDLSATDIDLQASSTVTVSGLGFAAQQGTGVGSSTSTNGGGGAYGGNGGTAQGGSPYGSVTQPVDLGSGGGDDTGNGIGVPGAGGGAIKLAATGTVTVNGTISANGTSATGGCGGDDGGGAGGSVWIDNPSGTVTGTGTITATGGAGKCTSGAGGGGGRVAVYYSGSAPSFTYQVTGGTATGQVGGAGTVYTKAAAQANGSLLVDNGDQTNVANTTQVVTASQTYDAITIRNGAKYLIPNTFTLALASGGTLTGGGTAQPLMTINSGGNFDSNAATFTIQGLDVTNASGGTVSDVTDLTLNDSTFDHDGDFSATVTQLTFASGASPSTFFHNGTGFNELTLVIGNSGTFVAETTSYTGLTSLTVQSTGTFRQQHESTIAITTVTVQSGGTITSGDNSTSKLYEVDISSTDIDIQASGTVTVSGLGFDAQQGTGVGGSISGSAGGGGYGGDGANAVGGAPYGSVTQPTDIGSGGGNDTGNSIGVPGAGGGSVKLAATGTVTVNGTISADGTAASGSCGGQEGGGSGGSVWISNPSGTVTGTGTITVKGGSGKCTSGGGGGGGRVAVYYSGSAPSFTYQAFGGPSVVPGGAGTVYTKAAAQTNGSLVVDNNNVSGDFTSQATTASQTYDAVTIKNGARYAVPNTFTLALATGGTLTGGGTTQSSLTVQSGGTFNTGATSLTFNDLDLTHAGALATVTSLTITAATYTPVSSTATYSAGPVNLTLGSGGTYSQQGTSTLAFAAIVVQSGGVMTHDDNSTAKSNVVDITASSIDIQSGGVVDVDQRGFDGTFGTGVGGNGASTAGGGGYGGAGGNGSVNGTGGSTYGSNTSPNDIGSGGGDDTGNTLGIRGSGGGAVKMIVSGTLTINGGITADGQNATGNGDNGGGSGGSIWVSAGTLAGSGTTTATGGNGFTGGGGGGGGRQAWYYGTKTYSGTCVVTGGSGGNSGSAGTCYEEVSSNCPIVDGGVGDDDASTNSVVTISSAKSWAASSTVYVCTATPFTIASGGTLTLQGNTGTGEIAQVEFATLTIDSGGALSADSQGCTGDGNEGNGPNGSNVCINDGGLGSFAIEDTGGGGGGHGGRGGANGGNANSGGGTYGSSTAPVLFGASGAGNGVGSNGGNGGGVVRITVTGTLTNNGIIAANGAAGGTVGGRGAGGGAGGSINITTVTLNGTTGLFRARGGAGGDSGSTLDGGGGGGGRVAISYANGSFAFDSTDIEVDGGSNGGGSGTAGATGTAYVVDSQGTAPSADDDVTIYHGFTYTDTDYSVATWTTDASATNQHCDAAIGSGATPSITGATSITFGGTLSCTPTHASFNLTAPTTSIAASASFTVNAATTLTASTAFSLGNGSTVANTKTNADMTFSIPAGNNQTWTNVTVNAAPEGDLVLSSAIAVTLAGSTSVQASTQWMNITDLTIDSTASINANGKGCVGDNAEGNGPNGSNVCVNDGGSGAFAVEDFGGGGGGHGGAGGANSGNANSGGGTYGSATVPVLIGASGAGSGSGANGGSGGGFVRINVSGTFTHNGSISANGADATGTGGRGAGGGAGGSIYVTGTTINGTTGTFSAKGGNGFNDSTHDGGGGGGGRIAITRTGGTYSVDSADFDVAGGTNGGGSGGAGAKGTTYVKNTATSRVDIFHGFTYPDTDFSETTWNVDASATNQYCDVNIAGSATPSVTATDVTLAGSFTCTQSITSFIATATNALSLAASGAVAVNGAVTLDGDVSFTLGSGASVSVTKTNADLVFDIPAGNNQTWNNVTIATSREGDFILNDAISVTMTGTSAVNANVNWTNVTAVSIASGSSLNANDKGCAGDNNEGNGPNGSNVCVNDGGSGTFAVEDFGGGGGGHGGAGGANAGNGSSGGGTYDSATAPVLYGASGAGNGVGSNGGNGGGLIRISTTGTFTNNGSITANGTNGGTTGGRGAGGGAGGSIYLIVGTYTCSSAPTFSASGGTGGASGSLQGGGGGGGRIRIEYSSDTCGSQPLTGLVAATVVPGGTSGGGSSTAGAVGSLSVFTTGGPPVVTVVSHTPASPTTVTSVTLSGTATDETGITQIEIYLDGTAPANLKHTCVFSPIQTPASCSINVGLLAVGAHTTTVRAYDGTATTDGTENFSVVTASSTLSNKVTMSRLKTGATSTVAITFTLQNTLSGPLTVTFPAGFTVTAAAIGGSSSGCLSSFGFTSSTLTATKTSCSGTVTLGGATVTNPGTPGVYYVSWVNDDPGGGPIIITDSDQVQVSFAVDPVITFNVGSQTAACDGTFAGNGGAIGLGALTTAAVASSDVSSVPHVCARISTNASSGAIVSVLSSFGALRSVSVPGDQIASSTATLVAGTSGYGLCAGSTGGDSGRDATTPVGATPTAVAPFNGSCSTSTHAVGGLTTSAQTVWSLSGPSQNAFFRLFLKAAVSPTVPAHADYQDLLTFIATGTY